MAKSKIKIRTTKTCSHCSVTKPIEKFNRNSWSPDGYTYKCKQCKLNEYRSLKGIAIHTHYRQRIESKIRGHNPPEYTRHELEQWFRDNKDWDRLYKQWVDSGFSRWYSVSVDRIDDYKTYSFDNIQLMSWKENKEKSCRDTKYGINTKRSDTIRQYDKYTNEFIGEYFSQAEAGRRTGIEQTAISRAVNGKSMSAGGFTWVRIKEGRK